MSDIKLISPLLDNYEIGDCISAHDGVSCYPALIRNTDEKYIIKIISIPASQTQLDALLLTGAYQTEEDALRYFQELSTSLEDEIRLLERLSRLEGFVCYDTWQTVQKEDSTGYDVYMVSAYRKTLAEHLEREPMTHLQAVNLGLDLCAALAVCRRAGYIYVDLRPGNIYIIHDKEYRIGDLGFVHLDSLKYASLPDKYRSPYTAPEITDAFSCLNTTVDVYAIGMILYQAYNNGRLPNVQDDGSLPPPDYADYEMAEIILKACATDPAARWQDPLEMGQALIGYMQRNSINDTPIVPPAVPDYSLHTEIPEPEAADGENVPDAPPDSMDAETVPDIMPTDVDTTAVDSSVDTLENSSPENTATSENTDPGEATPYSEDGFGNLSFLLDDTDEAASDDLAEDVDYSELSDEVSEILAQADELADHPVPEAVVAPDPIDVPIPEPMETPTTAEESQSAESVEIAEQPDDTAETEKAVASDVALESSKDEQPEIPETAPKKRFRGLGLILLALAIVLLAAACFLYYQHFYLMPINAITLDGDQDTLVVSVDSQVDEKLLKVVCTDSHGNQITMPVIDGMATFENLVPNTAYNVKLIVEGFHKLTGSTATAYSTPAQTSIVQFNAVTGAEDGSVILGFTVDGPDASEWAVRYFTDGEAEKTITFPSHMVTITGLTVGKNYTFILTPVKEMYVTGICELTFTADKLTYAQNLRATGFSDGTLTAAWDVPDDTAVENWTVRCYNEAGYSESIITADTTVSFDGLDHDHDYTIEVTAAGMSVSQRIYVTKSAFSVSNMQAIEEANKLTITWESIHETAAENWLLSYTIDSIDQQHTVACSENRAEISNPIPGATYTINLQGSDGLAALAQPFVYRVNDATPFNGYNVSVSDMNFRLYKVPGIVYTDHYAPTDSIYMLINLQKRTTSASDRITILYVIRNAEGEVVYHDSTRLLWRNMWSDNDCILAIPYTPQQPGAYTLSVYFNGAVITEQEITVESAAN